MNPVKLSVTIPLYNEAGNVQLLVKRLLKTLTPLNLSFELLLVDDGSSDATWQEISQIARNFPYVKGIKLSRNFGHQKALLAGLSVARGTAVISMDGDLQHPPELIPAMLKAWQEGYKIVNTIRHYDENTTVFKKVTSKWFYRVFSNLADVNLTEGSSDFRLLDRQVLDTLLGMGAAESFLRGTVEWLGFPTTTIAFEVEQRHAGDSKYSLQKMMAFAMSAIVSFSTKPLKFGIWLGLVTSTLSFIELIYVLSQFVTGATIPGWASTVGILAFLFGILFIILGIIGIYIARIHEVLQQQPPFIIETAVSMETAVAYPEYDPLEKQAPTLFSS